MAIANAHRLLRFAALAFALASLGATSASRAENKQCQWTVTSFRPPTAVELGYVELSDSAGFPVDSTVVPGFDWLEVFDRTDSLLHSYVYVKNLQTGTTELLLSESATLACRSPDGRYVACVIYTSHVASSVLTVVDLAYGKRLDPFPKANTDRVRWSPNSKYLAGESRRGYEQESSLSAISFPSGEVKILDATAAFGGYDFAWSPDSRWIAVVRPTGSFHYQDYFVSELWIISHTGDVRCKVVDPADWEEFALVWFADKEILLQRVFLREGEEGVESDEGTVVIGLKLDESADSPRPLQR